MHIDYSIDDSSKKYLYLDVPFQQGLQHMYLAFKGKEFGLSLGDQISHFTAGFFKMIPIIGHIFAGVDTALHSKNLTVIDLSGIDDPFERGRVFAQKCKSQLKEVYSVIIAQKGSDEELRKAAKEFEKQIDKEQIQELHGIAEGIGLPYADILFMHTFLDASPGAYGCTAMVRKVASAQPEQRIAAANHSVHIEEYDPYNESVLRKNALFWARISEQKPEGALKESGVADTIQSIVFDTNAKKITLCASGKKAFNKKFQTFHPFGEGSAQPLSQKRIELLRNLDWPWHFLGQNTILLIKKVNGKKIANVTFPGYIGTLSGMNEDGLALAICSRGDISNAKGTPNPLLFTQMLARCKTVEEAKGFLQTHSQGSSMNLVLADKDKAVSLELRGMGDFDEVASIAEGQ